MASTPLVYAIYLMVEPTYEAAGLLRADPTPSCKSTAPRPPGTNSPKDGLPYLLTQVQLITSDSVLDAALARPGISNLPMIRSSRDPKADLHELMDIGTVGDHTYLIKVSLASRDPAEAAAIVNAVVAAYIDQHAGYHKNTNRALKMNLETELATLEKKIQDVEARLMELQ